MSLNRLIISAISGIQVNLYQAGTFDQRSKNQVDIRLMMMYNL